MKLYPLLIAFTLIIFTQACKRDNPCSTYTSKSFNFLLADSNKAQIPYKGNETLMFISNLGDTAFLIGKGKNNYVLKNNINVGTSPDCPQYDNYSYEYADYDFKSTNNNLFHIFYRLSINEYSQTEITVYLNDISEYKADIELYNDTAHYNIFIKNTKGYNFDRNDDKPAFVYNKKIGILQVKIDSNLIYTLNP